MQGRVGVWPFFLAAIAVLACPACGNHKPAIDPATGGTLVAEDGASAQFLPGFSDAGADGSLKKIAEATGEVENERQTVSATYLLRVEAHGPFNSALVLIVPLPHDYAPTQDMAYSLSPEFQDPESGEWTPLGGLTVYDAETAQVAFNLEVVPVLADTNQRSLRSLSQHHQALDLRNEYLPFERKIRVRRVQEVQTIDYHRPGSNFIIRYYANPASPNAPRPDGEWQSLGSGTYTDPTVPHYIEDLDKALNEAYAGMLNLPASDGKVFSPLSLPQLVVVRECGGDAGESPLGGPAIISNRRLEDWNDMREVVGHELAHVFQGQYYTKGALGNLINFVFSGNRWFIEASATFYPAFFLNLDDTRKKRFYTKDGAEDFPNVALNNTSERNIYTAALFFDFIATEWGRERIGDTMKGTGFSTINILSDKLTGTGLSGGVGAAYEKFALWLVTHPEAVDGLAQKLRDGMQSFNSNPERQYFPSLFHLNDKNTFAQLKRPMAGLSMTCIELAAANNSDALLVVDPTASSDEAKSGDDRLLSYLFDLIGTTNAAFDNKTPLAKGLLKSNRPLLIRHFGSSANTTGMTHLIVNRNRSTQEVAEVAYYILVPPTVQSVTEGSVTWSTEGLGNIPRSFIDGYHVYRQDENSKWIRLTSAPLRVNSDTQQTWKSNLIHQGDSVLVQVVDRFENSWPEVEADVLLPKTCYMSVMIGRFFKETRHDNVTGEETVTEIVPQPGDYSYPNSYYECANNLLGKLVGEYQGNTYTADYTIEGVQNYPWDSYSERAHLTFTLNDARDTLLWGEYSLLVEATQTSGRSCGTAVTLRVSNLGGHILASEASFSSTGTDICNHIDSYSVTSFLRGRDVNSTDVTITDEMTKFECIERNNMAITCRSE